MNGDAETWHAATEGLLMSAARHEHVEQIIRPALARNELVISDRFVDSTIVYQGIVGGMSADDIAAISKIACGDIYPDITIILILTLRLVLSVPSHGGQGKTVLKLKATLIMKKFERGILKLRSMRRRAA